MSWTCRKSGFQFLLSWASVALFLDDFSTKLFSIKNSEGIMASWAAPGDANGMNERIGSLPAARELATKRCLGWSQRKDSRISWPSATVPIELFPMNRPSARRRTETSNDSDPATLSRIRKACTSR